MADQSKADLVIVYTTFPNDGVAKDICKSLVEKRLAACANLFPSMTAIYEWQGKLEQEAECAAFLKTKASLAQSLSEALKSAHPYDTPAILVLATRGADADYEGWVDQQTRPR